MAAVTGLLAERLGEKRSATMTNTLAAVRIELDDTTPAPRISGARAGVVKTAAGRPPIPSRCAEH